MKPIRIFISSPGDVKPERAITETIINRVASELGIPVSIRYSALLKSADGETPGSDAEAGGSEEELVLCPYYWEYQRYHADEGYQDQIPRTDRFELVVCILWSRMGSKLSAKFENPDGTVPRSGTEFEIQWARHKRQENKLRSPGMPWGELTPALHVYRNRSRPIVPDDPDKGMAFLEQKRDLEVFINDWQKTADGSFKGAFNSYSDLGQFERLFEAHFRDFLDPFVRKRKLPQVTARQLLWNPGEKGSPFRRLDVYKLEHEPIFCGRSKATGEVIDALRQQAKQGVPFVLIVGASGSGKSSLARAGVLPMLIRSGVIEGVEVWRHAVLRPGEKQHQGNPCRALAAAMQSETALPGLRDREAQGDPLDKLTKQLINNPASLIDRIEDQLNRAAEDVHQKKSRHLEKLAGEYRRAKRPGDAKAAEVELGNLEIPRARLALVIDQLEELFHPDRSEELVQQFLAALEKIAHSGRVFLIATLRSDFYDRYQLRPELLGMAGERGKVDLLPPDENEIGQIIRQPAAAAGLRYEAHPETGKMLDEEIRDQAKENPESLPLLSHLLGLLYEKQQQRGDGWLKWGDYEKLGKIEGALSTHAESVFNGKLEAREQEAFPHVLSGLVNLGSGDGGGELALRKEARMEDLIQDSEGKKVPGAARLIEVFSGEEGRLLTMHAADGSGERFVSISHEILLRKWDRVSKWVKENAEFLRRRDRVELMRQQYELALENDSNSADDFLLPPGLPLEEGVAVSRETGRSVSSDLRKFVKASQDRAATAERRKASLRRRVMAALGLLTMAAFGLGGWALVKQSEAKKAERNATIQEKASRARVLATTEPLTALALVLDTAEEEKQLKGGVSPPVLSSLLHTLESGREIARYSSVARGGAITDCAVSPDGSLIAYTAKYGYSAKYGVYVVDRESGLTRKVLPLPENVPARCIAFHPEGELLVVGDDQGTLSVLRLDDQKILWQHKAHDSSVIGLAWLAGNSQIVSCGRDGVLRFSTEGGKQASPDIPVPGGSVGAFAISPDGKVAAVAASESAAGDGARLINCETGEATKLETGDDLIRALAFNQSGSRLAGAGLDRVVRLWNRKGQPLGNAIRTGHEAIVNSLAFHPFEPLVVTGSKDGTLRAYTESGEQALAPLHGHTEAVWSVSFDKVGTNVVSAGEDGSVRVWDFPGLQAAAPIETGINCRALLFHPDGSRFAAGGMGGKINIYAYPSGELLRTVDAHPGSCDMLVPLADGSGFASLASTVNEVRVFSWQGETGGEVFRDSGGRISMIAAHPQDPVLFALGRSGELHHLSLPSLEPLRKTPFLGSNDKVVTSSGLAVIPEDNCLLFRGAYSIELRQIEEPGKSLARDGALQSADYQKYNLAFSPDRKLVLTGGRQESGHSLFNLYRLPQLEHVREMEAPWRRVPIAAFNHSGRELALLSDSGMLQFFSINGEAEGPELRAHEHHPRGFAVHPKDDVLATAGGGGWIRFWRFGQEAWMEAARIRLGRAKARDPRSQSFLARTASHILSRNPSATARGSDGRLAFPAAGISLKIPQGWVQFDPRGLALLEGLMTAMGSDEMKRAKIRGAFSKGDKVQLHLVAAPNFYLGTIDEYRGVESFAEQLPEVQAKLESLVRGRAQTLGFATEIAFGRPAWNAGLRAFLTEGGGKGADGNLIRVKIWSIPTKSHMVAIGFFGDANLAREVEAIIETLEIDAAIAPDDEEYARVAKTLEAAIAVLEQRGNRLKEIERDQAQYYALCKRGEAEQAKGNTDEALKNYKEALSLVRKWTKGSNGSPSQKPGEASTVSVNSFSVSEIKALHRIAWLHTIHKDADRAEAAEGEAIALLKKLRQPLKEQSAVEFHSMEAYCFQGMCRVLAMRKDYTAAAAWMQKSVAARRKSTEADPLKAAANQIRLADALRLLSEMQRDAEDCATAIASAKEAIEVAEGIAESVRDPTWPKVVSGYYRVLAENFQAAGKGDGEITAAEASLRLAGEAKNAYPDDSSYRWAIASERYYLMDALRRHAPERLEETIALLREVADEIAAIREVAGEGGVAGNDTRRVESGRRRLLVSLLLKRAMELQAQGASPDEELRLLDQAVAEAEKAARLFAGSTADTRLQEIYYHRGDFYSRQQRYAESAADFGKRVALFRQMASSRKGEEGKRDLALALHNYAASLQKSGEVAEAEVANDEAREIMEGIVVASPDDFQAKGFLIAMIGTGTLIAERSGGSEAARALRARRLALAGAIIESHTSGIDPLIQVYYTYSSEASYRKANKIGESGDWISLYEKALIAVAKIESTGKLTDWTRKHREASVRSLEELRASVAK